jgi:hypothetical protein
MFTTEQIAGFCEAAQSLKLYRRAELFDDVSGKPLVNELYVDPLPHDAVINGVLKANTTFLIGRRGTGKSTIFQKAQALLRDRKGVISAYVDIKTIFEESQIDPSVASRLAGNSAALGDQSLEKLLLYRGFLGSLLGGIRDELKKKLRGSWWESLKERFTGTVDELFEDLDHLLREANTDRFNSVLAVKTVVVENKQSEGRKEEAKAEISIGRAGPAGKISAGSNAECMAEGTQQFSDILMRSFDLKQLLAVLKELLGKAGIRHLYIFVDDFSELPEEAMKVTVDALLAPLNNWSEEFIKFKIAAYPSRVYYGAIDKTKVDELYLDIFQLYGAGDVNSMESKAADFIKRLVSSRVRHFCKCDVGVFFETDNEDLWMNLFFASMANPRTLGYLLFYAHELSLIYEKPIGLRSIRDVSRRFYEEKIESYFATNRFLHESFAERSSIFSLKELLEKIVARARELRKHSDSQVMKEIPGRPPTSHFHVVKEYESIFASLELNFFLSKYFEMSDRDGKKVSVFALNFGLCQKYSIEFGRPSGKREFRLYFVERVFDYSSIIRAHIEANQEIICEGCGSSFSLEHLEMLKFFGMLCPKCKKGTCRVTNLSKKYEETLRAVDEKLLLPSTELGILKTLHSEKRPLFAGEIAEELDCSHQLVGRRAKNLADRGLVNRKKNTEQRREFSITEDAEKSYFVETPENDLQVPQEGEDLGS